MEKFTLLMAMFHGDFDITRGYFVIFVDSNMRTPPSLSGAATDHGIFHGLPKVRELVGQVQL